MITIQTDVWKVSGVNGVLFDKDGTLIDSHLYWGRIIERRAHAIIHYFSQRSDLYPDLCNAMGYSLTAQKLRPEGPIALVSREEVIHTVDAFLAQQGIPSTPEILSDLFVKEHKLFLAELFEYIELLPSVLKLLASLKEHSVKTAVVTTDAIANTEAALRHLHIDHYFDAVIGKESTDEPKITGKPAQKALHILGLAPEESICIGDAPMDLIMAKKSDLKAGIGIASGQIGLNELRKYTPYVSMTMGSLSIVQD
jgi:phosphoglycolate phosphatase